MPRAAGLCGCEVTATAAARGMWDSAGSGCQAAEMRRSHHPTCPAPESLLMALSGHRRLYRENEDRKVRAVALGSARGQDAACPPSL